MERARIWCNVMKSWQEIKENQVLETHLNLMSDFTGSCERILTITFVGYGLTWFPSQAIEESEVEPLVLEKILRESFAKQPTLSRLVSLSV